MNRRSCALAALSLSISVASCFAPPAAPSAACRVRCGNGDACPDGTSCGTDDYCHAPGEAADACLVSIVVTPGAATLLPETTQQITAQVTGAADTTATWEILDANGGTVGADGVYQAPAMLGTYHVRARSHADPKRYADATFTVTTAAPPTTLANAGTIATATGMSCQSHLVHAAGEWWLFYDDSAALMKLRTRHSPDFTTGWSDGADVTLDHPHSGDGRDLSVATRRLGGHDVVHITQGWRDPDPGRWHIRATLGAGAITFDPPITVNSGAGDEPDGAATAITADGHVLDSTGWLMTPTTPPLTPCGVGDVVVYESMGADDGTAFDDASWFQQVRWCVGNMVNARQLLADGDTIYQLFEDGELDGHTVNVLVTERPAGGTWLPDEPISGPKVTPPGVFGDTPPAEFDVNDWRAVLDDTRLHVVRRRGDGAYQHRMIDLATSVWSDGGAIPPLASNPGAGLYLARYGAGLVLVAIDSAAGNAVRYTAWSSTTNNWSAWHPLVTTPSTRNFIAGSAPVDGERPAVIWTESTGAPYDIVGVELP